MKQTLRQRWRMKILNWLRPGQTEHELLRLVKRAECIQSDEQRRMLIQAVEFHDTRVREIMTPRSHLKAIDVNISAQKLEQEILEATSTRLPVIDGDFDHIVGVVHLWDLFAAKVRGENIVLRDMVRPCPKISELQRVTGLISEMREGSHIAIVQDEFGGTAGLVTLSDLLEEIVGSIDEGTKEIDAGIMPRSDGSYEVLALVHVEDLSKTLNRKLPYGEYDTIGGLVTHHLGRIPMMGEKMTVAGVEITVLQADPRRVVRVKVKVLKKKA